MKKDGENINIWTNDFNPFQRFKILCWYDRMRKISTGQFDAPVNIQLDIVQGTKKHKLCGGVKCNFCMSDLEDKGETAKVPKDILFDMPRFFKEWGVMSLCIAGHNSDPLAYNNEDFCRFLRECSHYNIDIGVPTNGYLLNDMLIQEMARSCKWTGFSVNAGKASTFAAQTQTTEAHFDKIINNINSMSEYCKKYKICHGMGYKYLITDENYNEIIDAIKLAKTIGIRHIQLRPCELPEERRKKIDVKVVEEQIKEGLELEEPGVFEIFGVREKFNTDFSKKPPRRCIATPLGSTWKADGDVVICPDRKWSAHLPNMKLGNFVKEGLESIRRKWCGEEHMAMIKEANNRLGECIRCTCYQWHNIYENTITSDEMGVSLI